jgi:hypothetical protein
MTTPTREQLLVGEPSSVSPGAGGVAAAPCATSLASIPREPLLAGWWIRYPAASKATPTREQLLVGGPLFCVTRRRGRRCCSLRHLAYYDTPRATACDPLPRRLRDDAHLASNCSWVGPLCVTRRGGHHCRPMAHHQRNSRPSTTAETASDGRQRRGRGEGRGVPGDPCRGIPAR